MELRHAERELDALLRNMRVEMEEAISNEVGGFRGKVASKGTKPILNFVAKELREQGEVGLRYAQEYGNNPDIDEYTENFVKKSPLYQNVNDHCKDELWEKMRGDLESYGDIIGPLFETDQDDFWSAAEEVYSEEKAKSDIGQVLRQLDKYEKYLEELDVPGVRNGKIRIPGMNLERIERVIETGEDRFIDYVNGRIEQEFDSAGTQVN
jgi:hypothetical protein